MNKHNVLMAVLLAAGLALAGCGGGSSGPVTPPDNEMTPKELADAATTALNEAKTAVDMVMDDSENTVVTDADTKVKAAKAAVNQVPAAQRADLSERLGKLEARLDAAKVSRTAALEKKRMAEAAAMKETAGKLYAGIAARNFGGSNSVGRRGAYFDDQNLKVQIDGNEVTLKKDKEAMVPAIKDWVGEKYTLTEGVDTYEAYIYGDMAEGSLKTLKEKHDEYDETTGVLPWAEVLRSSGSRIGRTGFGITAGYKTYPPDNPGGTEVTIKGTYLGVPGTYRCVPNKGYRCAAYLYVENNDDKEAIVLTGQQIENEGYRNDNVTWTFKADDPKAKVRQADAVGWSMYGWWIKKSSDTGTLTASAFYDIRSGSVTGVDRTNVPQQIHGDATYEGGAAGLYALYSNPSSGHDAGQFVADARFEANFDTDKVSGVINNFRTGNLGTSPERPRDWSVELMPVNIKNNNTSVSSSTPNAGAHGETEKTKWTIGGTAAAASGNWFGGFSQKDNGIGKSVIPQTVIGNFYSEYGRVGKIVGGFGANLKTQTEE